MKLYVKLADDGRIIRAYTNVNNPGGYIILDYPSDLNFSDVLDYKYVDGAFEYAPLRHEMPPTIEQRLDRLEAGQDALTIAVLEGGGHA